MLNNVVSIFNAVASWIILGVVNMTFTYPVTLVAILVALAVAACAVLSDALSANKPPPDVTSRPIRVWRR